MASPWVPQSRAERLVASSRLVLALASLLAIYLDPLEPARFIALTYSLLVVYSVYSVGLLIISGLTSGYSLQWQIATHVIDLLFFSTINYLTEGPTSPFFVYFVFSLICANLRFGRAATIATAGVSIAVFFGSGFFARADLLDFELNRFIIRSAYLAVVATLLIHLAQYQQKMQRELAGIATWSRSRWSHSEELVEQLIVDAAMIVDAPRILLAWERAGTSFAYLGTKEGSEYSCEAQPADVAISLVDRIAGGSIVTRNALAESAVAVESKGWFRLYEQPALPKDVVLRFNIRSMLGTPFEGEFTRGILFFLDRADFVEEDVAVAKIVASIIASRLDYFYSTEHLQRGAVAEERVRLARDLHDSVLQTLTGAALQLQTLHRLIQRDPRAASERIADVQETIAGEQKELRWFIEQLDPEKGLRDSVDLSTRLQALAKRFRTQWDLDIASKIDASVRLLPGTLQVELFNLASEAVANAARHASARRVDVNADVAQAHVILTVSDDGKGFPFRGRYDLLRLNQERRGPATLKERVAALRGDLLIDSSDHGSRLEMRIPIQAGGGLE